MPKAKAAAPATTVVPGLPAHIFGQTGSPGINIPAGRHLVIETVSVQVDVTPSGSKIEAFINYVCAGNAVQLFVPLTYAYTESNHFDFHVAMQAVRLYADPGTAVSVTAYSPGGTTGTLFLTASGYLI
jgi:hypothetical protein